MTWHWALGKLVVTKLDDYSSKNSNIFLPKAFTEIKRIFKRSKKINKKTKKRRNDYIPRKQRNLKKSKGKNAKWKRNKEKWSAEDCVGAYKPIHG